MDQGLSRSTAASPLSHNTPRMGGPTKHYKEKKRELTADRIASSLRQWLSSPASAPAVIAAAEAAEQRDRNFLFRRHRRSAAHRRRIAPFLQCFHDGLLQLRIRGEHLHVLQAAILVDDPVNVDRGRAGISPHRRGKTEAAAFAAPWPAACCRRCQTPWRAAAPRMP